ncbi:hypothetical protein J2X56_001134 [Herbaspirillum sp. 1173]|uniref:hypothetical protein n=1 Tax=Herbaspirillum sp. 1173 TaxID=2817734 RepID=UPI0028607FA7|nr:hypothetical protein [Herbaspirillum sp. 1173]MDR6739148.1 hypothetical protein [Herbaspirillum sp. 1173]
MDLKRLVQFPPPRDASKRAHDNYSSAISANQLRIADLVFVLQYAIRRLKLEQSGYFAELMKFRQSINSVLDSIPDHRFPELATKSRPRVLSELMNFLTDDDIPELTYPLTPEKEEFFIARLLRVCDRGFLSHGAAEEFFSMPKLRALLGIFASTQEVRAMIVQLNYCEYYTPYALSTHIAGETLYTSYIKAKVQAAHEQGEDAQLATAILDSAWLRKPDHPISALLQTVCYEPLGGYNNIDIVGGSRNTVLVDGKKLTDRLLLSVPIATSPRHIDRMLAHFRTVLREEAAMEHGGDHGISSPEFDSSVFMNHLAHTSCLIGAWDQVLGHTLGLWAWDKIHDDGQPAKRVFQDIANELETWRDRLGESVPTLNERTIEEYYERTAREISPTEHRQSIGPANIDMFLIGSVDKILGESARVSEDDWIDWYVEEDEILEEESTEEGEFEGDDGVIG